MRRREFVAGLVGAAAWPLAARAQQLRRVGILEAGNAYQGQAGHAFRTALESLGWQEGQNIQFIARAAPSSDSQTKEYATELAGLSLDVILATNTQMVQALHKHTRATPIVFIQVPDPVGSGVVDSLSRPSGNTTGLINFDSAMASKWLELIKEIAPEISVVGVLLHYNNPTAVGYLRAIEAAAPVFGLALIPAWIRDASDLEPAVKATTRPSGGMIIPPSSMASVYQEQIIARLTLERLPAISSYREYPTSGGLMSYGYDRSELFRRAASYVDRILRGTKPIDLPVQSPTKFELVINVNAGRAIGLHIPPSLLARADEVIE